MLKCIFICYKINKLNLHKGALTSNSVLVTVHDVPRDKFFALIKWLYIDKCEKAKRVVEDHATEHKSKVLDLRPLPSPLICVAFAGPRTYQDLLWDKIKNGG